MTYYAYPKIIRWSQVSVVIDGLPLVDEEGGSFGVVIVYETREAFDKTHPGTEPLLLESISANGEKP